MASRSDVPRRPAPVLRSSYRRIFIVDGRDAFAACRELYDAAADLVLTYDFALRRELSAAGGDVFYVDHLVDSARLNEDNFRAYEFFQTWHTGKDGTDHFVHRGVPYGMSFRLDFWNDFICFVRARLCLDRLRETSWSALYVRTELGLVEAILGRLGIPFEAIVTRVAPERPHYFFPIHRWMRENIRRRGVRGWAIETGARLLGSAYAWTDRLFGGRGRPLVFVQDYHPTRTLIQRLRRDRRVRVVRTAVARHSLWSRYIPLGKPNRRHEVEAARALAAHRAVREARLVVGHGLDLTNEAYELIEQCVAPRVATSLRRLEDILDYVKQLPIALEVLIANIGDVDTLVDCVCRARGVPSYLIANGLLLTPFVDDSKYATTINAYSESVRDHYFRGMTNIVCEGDPRMDRYVPLMPRRPAPSGCMHVAIGASGHSNTDLNSYVAVEFEFLDGVLSALALLKAEGVLLTVTIKVRANGYASQYRDFAAEYYPGLVDEIVADAPMSDVLAGADCLVSIYSQTLFEASCLGIPAVYFRVDDEYKYQPFDGESEVVTVDARDELLQALRDVARGHPRFDAFMAPEAMSKYIGPLDGGNLERNLRVVHRMLGASHPDRAS